MRHKTIYVHGFAVDGRVWDGFLEPESAVVTLPSHGCGSWDKPSLEPAVEAVLEYAETDKKIIGVGWSIGAMALIKAASLYPDRFCGLALVAATPSFIERDGFPYGQKKALLRRMAMDVEKDAAGTLRRFYALNFTADEMTTGAVKKFLRAYEKMPMGFDASGLSMALGALANEDLRDAASLLCLPVLLIHGSADAITSPGASIELSKTIKGSRLSIFDGSGHAPLVTNADRFSKELKEFVSSL